jgi:hypothetical protein
MNKCKAPECTSELRTDREIETRTCMFCRTTAELAEKVLAKQLATGVSNPKVMAPQRSVFLT